MVYEYVSVYDCVSVCEWVYECVSLRECISLYEYVCVLTHVCLQCMSTAWVSTVCWPIRIALIKLADVGEPTL